VYTNPEYQDIKALQSQVAQYDDALNKSQELKSTRDKLLAKYNTFSDADKEHLQEIIPDNVDNIRLVIDLNNIAARHGLAIKNLDLGSVTSGSKSSSAVGASQGPVGSVDFTFSVTTDYPGFISFLQDLEHSLRIIDVVKMSFAVTDKGTDDYLITIRTYWLR
jgi:hypothetical protein